MEKLTSKQQEKSMPTVELKSLPSHLRYEFLNSDHKFPFIISSKLDGLQFEKLLDVLSIGVPLVILLMILRESVLHFACIASF